jgi:hypothetical protein
MTCRKLSSFSLARGKSSWYYCGAGVTALYLQNNELTSKTEYQKNAIEACTRGIKDALRVQDFMTLPKWKYDTTSIINEWYWNL